MGDRIVIEETSPGHFRASFTTAVLCDLLEQGMTPAQIQTYLQNCIYSAVAGMETVMAEQDGVDLVFGTTITKEIECSGLLSSRL